MRPRARRHPAASDDLIQSPQQHIGPRAGKCLTEESRNHRRQDGRLGDQRTAREHVDDLLQFLRASDSSDKTAGRRYVNFLSNPIMKFLRKWRERGLCSIVGALLVWFSFS